MGRCSKSRPLAIGSLDLCDLVDNLCEHISQNSCDDDHGNGDGHDTAKLLGNTIPMAVVIDFGSIVTYS